MECQKTLEEFKQYLSSPPPLHTPKANEQLYLYLEVSEVAVRGVLVREEEGMQVPIYYVSRILGDAETSYAHLEKLAFALLSASRKLKPYFQCHPICVVTSYIKHKPEISGQLEKWAIEVRGYDIEYKLRISIKSQILADFVDDFTPSLIPKVDKELLLASGTSSGVWTLFVDDTSNAKRFGLGIVLKPPTGNITIQSIRTVKLKNNEVEYKAMIIGLKLDKSLGAEVTETKYDSLLVINQVNGTFEVKEYRIQRYLDELQCVLYRFREWTLQYVLRDQNNEVDALSNLGSSVDSDEFNSGTMVTLMSSVIEEGHAKVNSTSLTWYWRNRYIDYLQKGKLPSDPKESRALQTKAARFSLVEGEPYRRSFFGSLTRCLGIG
ncbi:uncharacterized protein LOC142171867 [Nicotiana tabacum]|uniref:Uncharacterized protein LOC142171867 n=1 Tax=Nicotiana tabacum TaxID=4097 RepID=A0AC58T394_TOBAC